MSCTKTQILANLRLPINFAHLKSDLSRISSNFTRFITELWANLPKSDSNPSNLTNEPSTGGRRGAAAVWPPRRGGGGGRDSPGARPLQEAGGQGRVGPGEDRQDGEGEGA